MPIPARVRMKPFPRASRKKRVPRFSVIIPTCNRPRFLADAIASVLVQSFHDLELIVVNDGDALPPLPQDRRIRHLENARRGAIAARNLAVRMARGEAIAWLDDDDFWCDGTHLARAAAALDAGAAFTFADGEMRFADGTPPRRFSHGASPESLARDNTILMSAVCYARSLHDELGLFDADLPFYADWDWHLRVARSGHQMKHIAAITAAIRIHALNISGVSSQAARQANLSAFASKHGLGPLSLKTHVDFT